MTTISPSRAFARRLLAWYATERRDLPWRRTAAPWAVWVSEVMLQQTRVEAVVDRYTAFMRAYPDPGSWAVADDEELHAAWAGLGYYRRARLLRAGARQVLEHHGGELPQDPIALSALPGIGSYTCGAITSIAFGHCVAAIDGNVERVMARHRGIGENVKRRAGWRRVEAAVLGAIDPEQPGDFNQALMELGAMVCTPRQPRCEDCPVGDDCVARAEGRVGELPVLPARRASVPVTSALVHVPDAAGVLAYRIPDGEVNAGQLELPGPGLLRSYDSVAELTEAVHARCGARLRIGPQSARFQHGITHHRIEVHVFCGEVEEPGELRAELGSDTARPWSTASRKAFARLEITRKDEREGERPA